MVAILPTPASQASAAANASPPATATSSIGFPMLILAAVIVSAGIYVVDQFDTRAAWLLAFLVLLGVAFGYKDFGNEITSLFGTSVANQQTNVPSGQLLPGQQGPLPTVTPTTNVASAGV